ncbi:uncharacterized protein [Montipora capricornis]|uniref:uncharacterized protein n=1 Tax=Montipora capricornis TaxID=246305 RepID=UPI0035F19686
MENIFKGLGSVTGRFYNSHQEWQKAPVWVKEHYKLEEQQHCGDITTIPSGALQGAVNAVAELAKQNPTDATQMGIKIAQTAGIKPEYGLAFASGFLGTARFEKSEQKN